MTQRTFTQVAGVIFLVIAVLHLLRLIFGWEAVIAGWPVPHILSWIALFVSGALAFTAFKLSR